MNVTSAQLAGPLTTLTHHTGPWYRTGEHKPLKVIVWHGSAVSESVSRDSSQIITQYATVNTSPAHAPATCGLAAHTSQPGQPSCAMNTQRLGLDMFGQCFHDSPK